MTKRVKRGAGIAGNKIQAVLMPLMVAMSGAAVAADDNPFLQVFTPYVSVSVVHDDNLLGLSSQTDPALFGTLTGSGSSDTFYNKQIGVRFDKQISLQRFTANVNLTDVRFDKFRQLNHQDKSLNGNWEWHVGNNVGGNLGLSYAQSLTPFVDFHQLALNLRTQRTEYVNGYWTVHPSWRVRGEFSRYQLDYDLAAQQAGNRRQNVTEAGLDYLARSGSTVGVQLRHTDANFPNLEQINGLLVANSYSQNEAKAKIDWLVSGQTKLEFLGGWVSRKQDALAERNFSGFNARVVADWQATGKLGTNLSVWREIGAVDDLTTVYSLNHGISAALVWRYSEKIRLDAQVRREQRNFDPSAISNGVLASNSNDILRSASLIALYQPTRHWQLQLTLARRSSNPLNAAASFNRGYVSNSIAFDTRYEF